jgi:phytoene dehydrogenase-like protein
MMWHLHHGQGVAYVKGGAKEFGLALASVVEAAGGQISLRTRVAKVLLEQGKAVGVELEDGSAIRAAVVVSNADPFQTYTELLSPDSIPSEWRERLKAWQPSVSGMAVHLGVEMPMDAPAHSAIVHDTYDFDAEFADAFAASPSFPSWMMTVTTKSDPERGQAGQNMVTLFAPVHQARDDRWQSGVETGREVQYRQNQEYLQFKETVGSCLIAKAEQFYPGLNQSAFVRRVATPLTIERYTFNYRGALTGWAQTPLQSGAHRPGVETPVPRFYQTGQWCFPGAGIAPAMISGKMAAEKMRRDA